MLMTRVGETGRHIPVMQSTRGWALSKGPTPSLYRFLSTV
jgi:hypothetical protein